MSKMTDGKVWGLMTLLLLVLPAIFMIPTGSMGLSMVTLKVTVVDEVKDPITGASVSAVNVHSGVSTQLYYDAVGGYYTANVMPGTYEVTATAADYASGSMIVEKISESNQDSVHPITLLTMDNAARLNLLVQYDGDAFEGATAYIFADGFHKTSVSAENGWANFTGPNSTVHLLVFADGKLTYSENVLLNESAPVTMTIGMVQRPSMREGTYRILGDVVNEDDENQNPVGIGVHVWDVTNGHIVPFEGMMAGSISLPLYASTFRLLIEADGFEPEWMGSITLDSDTTYYVPEGESFMMTPVDKAESRVTTVDMTGANGVEAPTIHTIWTLDANSRIFGFENSFGTPRMQAAGQFYSSEWLDVDTTQAEAVQEALLSYGPAWAVTDDFIKVNGKAFEASGDFTVATSGFEGDVFEAVNPVVDMSQGYTSEIAFTGTEALRIEVLTVLPGEQVLVKIPANYEILGEFGENAEFPYMNDTSMILVKEPLEFTAKKERSPVAQILFVNAAEHYRAWDRNYTVALNKNVTLSGQSSSDIVGKVSTYTWTIPAGVTYKMIKGNMTGTSDTEADKITVQFTSNTATFSKIDLVVTDSSGLTSKPASIWIKPDGAAPSLETFTVKIVGKTDLLTLPATVDEDVELEFNATSATDNGNITNYVWTFGDKTAPLNGKVVKHRFADPGAFNISLKVTDSVKNELKLENVTTITVKDITKPAAVINPFSSEPKMGTNVTLNATQSYDWRSTKNVDDLASYSWTWFDKIEKKNVTVTGKVIIVKFLAPGEYDINLTVTDAAGLKGWTHRTLMVSGPDLEVRNVEFREPSINKIQEGKKVKISIPIVNNGEMKVTDSWKIKVELAGKKIKEDTITEDIDPKETYYYNFTFTPGIDGRDKELKVTVDVDNNVLEEIETANEYKTTIDIKAKEPIIRWWWFFIALAVLLVVYVVFMKVTRNEWGHEPVQKWWSNRKKN
jgi:hypothetical protein